jgi:hypothetical protein
VDHDLADHAVTAKLLPGKVQCPADEVQLNVRGSCHRRALRGDLPRRKVGRPASQAMKWGNDAFANSHNSVVLPPRPSGGHVEMRVLGALQVLIGAVVALDLYGARRDAGLAHDRLHARAVGHRLSRNRPALKGD